MAFSIKKDYIGDNVMNLPNPISSERLIILDPLDNIIGYETKAECHKGKGILHRAFSIFIFNSKGELLIQERSSLKPLWPLYWSNSVCSHPREGEEDLDAAHRRLKEEINIDTPLTFLFKFQYSATYKKNGNEIGSENELCSVYRGVSDAPISANPDEIANWKYVNIYDLTKDIANNPEHYTPWFKMEWERIQREYLF